jgi:hypothetical protein
MVGATMPEWRCEGRTRAGGFAWASFPSPSEKPEQNDMDTCVLRSAELEVGSAESATWASLCPGVGAVGRWTKRKADHGLQTRMKGANRLQKCARGRTYSGYFGLLQAISAFRLFGFSEFLYYFARACRRQRERRKCLVA